jgi:hypothetical protein
VRGGEGGSEEDDLEAGRGEKVEPVEGGSSVPTVVGLVDLVKDEVSGEVVLGVGAEPGVKGTVVRLVDAEQEKAGRVGRARPSGVDGHAHAGETLAHLVADGDEQETEATFARR